MENRNQADLWKIPLRKRDRWSKIGRYALLARDLILASRCNHIEIASFSRREPTGLWCVYASMKNIFSLVPLALLAACHSQPAPEAEPAADETAAVTQAPPIAPQQTLPAADPAQSATSLTLAGLGDLRIGKPVPADSRWSAAGAQASDSCLVFSAPDYPGAYAIVEGGKVRRISIGQRSQVRLVEGIGVGATEAEVLQYFPFPATPHKYVDAPGKYLTAPNADSGGSALRFEIGSDGTVSQIHVGTMPVLGYVEACS